MTMYPDLLPRLRAPWRHGRLRRLAANAALMLAMVAAVAGCASPLVREAQELAQAGQHEAALARLNDAVRAQPDHRETRLAWLQQRERTVAELAMRVDAAWQAGQRDEARAWLDRLVAVAPQHPRTAALQAEAARDQRLQALVTEAEQAVQRQQWEQAELALRTVLGEAPRHEAARALLARVESLREAQTRARAGAVLRSAHRAITLEFREAPLRTVFETLARAADVNFVFDKDVRADSKVTLFLRQTTVDEALRLLTSTQQLGHKLLNDNTVLVYPATAQKARELLDTVTRTFYLVNADPKQVQQLVRTVAKSRDVFIDERLNMLVVRDTPEVIRLVEQLVQGMDLPDPEVVLEMEVLEVSSRKLDEIGLSWPQLFNYGVPGSTAPLTSDSNLRWYAPNPLGIVNLKSTRGATNLLANPRIRARNREKAKVLLGEKLPVFTTTSTANVGVSASVSYLDVGLKLEIEPQVQLDNDVTIKVMLEVSSITDKVSGPQGSIAYQVGTRQASTTLRLRDGETQILAGLINDNESRNSVGVPGLHQLPLAGRLFGNRTDNREKTEIVLLVTPRIVRNLVQPPVSAGMLPSGTEAQPGARPLSLRDGTGAGGIGGASRGGAPSANAAGDAVGDASGRSSRGSAAAAAPHRLSAPEEVMAGSSFQVTVHNDSSEPLESALMIDSALLLADGQAGSPGRVALSVPPQGAQSVMVRVRAEAGSGETALALESGTALWRLRIQGSGASAAPSDEADPADNDGASQ